MSRLSDLLTELKSRRQLTNPQIVESAKRKGMKLSGGNVSNYLNGKHPENPPLATLEAFAKVFGVPVSELEEAAAYTGREPFNPDPTSDRLTQPQRNAVNEIIRLLAAGNQGSAHDTGTITSLSARSREGTTPETTPQKMKPLPARYAADQGDSAGEEGWAEAQQLGEESQDDAP